MFAFEANDPRIASVSVRGDCHQRVCVAVRAAPPAVRPERLLLDGIDGLTDDGAPDDFLGGANLTSLAMADPLGLIVVLVVAAVVAVPDLDLGSARRQRPAVPGVGRRHDDGHHGRGHLGADRRGRVRWRHGRRDRRPRVGSTATLGLGVFQSVFAQGLTSDPLDKTISYTIVFFILGALPITVRTMFSRGEAAVSA